MSSELILGPPGTGKTTALLDIVEQQIALRSPPTKIGFISFTRRAAEEAINRAVDKFGLSPEQFPWFRTLHSLCYRCIGLKSSDVMGIRQMRDFAKWAGIDYSGKASEDGTLFGFSQGDRILHMEHVARARCRSIREQYDEDDDGLPWNEVNRISHSLAEYKRREQLTDYNDMLSDFLTANYKPNLDLLVIDECQDLSKLQHKVVDLLRSVSKRVVYAGDDDQAIYAWAGADAQSLIAMDCPSRVLNRSWRVPRSVQGVASEVISRVKTRREKIWEPRNEEGIVERVSGLAQMDLDGPDILILVRNTYVAVEQVIPELRRRGVYYSWRGEPGIAARIVAAVRAWERLRAGGTVSLSEARAILGFIAIGRGRVAAAHLEYGPEDREIALEELPGVRTRAIWHEALDRLPRDDADYLLAARRRGERIIGGTPRVRVSTIHGSKGGEANHVILMTDIAKRTLDEERIDSDAEARVWYVAITRARQRLTIVDPNSGNYYSI